jgi:hypothetical protein
MANSIAMNDARADGLVAGFFTSFPALFWRPG